MGPDPSPISHVVLTHQNPFMITDYGNRVGPYPFSISYFGVNRQTLVTATQTRAGPLPFSISRVTPPVRAAEPSVMF